MFCLDNKVFNNFKPKLYKHVKIISSVKYLKKKTVLQSD